MNYVAFKVALVIMYPARVIYPSYRSNYEVRDRIASAEVYFVKGAHIGIILMYR
jgi:hypothetical protein